MNTPGVSLFQGAETLKVNSTLERQEEEEALQDQKRREAELGNLLENAFDDLDDDDEESTVDSTTNFSSNMLPPPMPLLPPLSSQQQLQQQPQQQLEYVSASEIHKLKMLLESKNHELNNVNKLATEARTKAHDVEKRLFLNEAELERARMEKTHTHELLVESKEKCSNLEDVIEKLRSEKKALETENTELVGKLETAQTVLDDVQRKYDMVEGDKQRRDDRNVDLRIKHLEEHHRAQAELIQHQLNQLTDQLDKKQQELDQMHMRYNALQSSHESMLLDKADKINELNTALDVAQRRCNQLASKQSYESEYLRQKQCVSDLQAQITSMQKTIAELTDRLNGTTAEMDSMDTLIQQHQSESETPSRLPSHLTGSTPLNPAERMCKFKQDFYRTFAMMKSKREEVRRLEKQLDDRTNELRTLRDTENKMLVQIATLKEDKTRMENRIKVLEEQLEERQHNSSLSTSRLQSELDTVKAECNALRQQTDAKTLEHQRVDKQLKKVQLDLDELQQEHENLKRSHDQLTDDNRQLLMSSTADNLRLELERHKILLNDAQGEVDRLKKLYSDIANDKESLNYQLRKLSESDSIKELQEQRQQLAQFQRNLQLSELKSQELAKILATEKQQHERELEGLRDKHERQKHEELTKAAKEGSNNCSKCSDKLAEITKMEIQMLKVQNLNSMQAKKLEELAGELEQLKALKLELEVKVKKAEEQSELQKHCSPIKEIDLGGAGDGVHVFEPPASSEISQARIKQIEHRMRDEMAKLFASELKRYTVRFQQAEERSLHLYREYQLVCRDLQQRQTEVDVLKQTILAEREQMQELLGKKDEKHKQMEQKCRNLMREMEEHHASIESERRSMKTVMAEWDKQKQSIAEVEEHWRHQMQNLRENHEEALQAAHQRYQSAKRTALNYKLYAEDKDAHMKREYDRLKLEYHNSLTKIEANMQKHLNRKGREQQEQQKLKENDKENEPCNR